MEEGDNQTDEDFSNMKGEGKGEGKWPTGLRMQDYLYNVHLVKVTHEHRVGNTAPAAYTGLSKKARKDKKQMLLNQIKDGIAKRDSSGTDFFQKGILTQFYQVKR